MSDPRALFQPCPKEQALHAKLIEEAICLYGQELYYIPRVSLNTDQLFQEQESSAFVDAMLVYAYIKDVYGFQGQGDFVSSMGLEIRDQVSFEFSVLNFNKVVANTDLQWANTYASANVSLGNNMYTDEALSITRPREGDLLWFPMAGKMFEIKYIEDEAMFYTFNAKPMYEARCESYEYNGEHFATGNTTIDTMMNAFSLAVADGGANNDLFDIRDTIEAEANSVIDFTEDDPFSEGGFF